jgi:hypothetical protein
MERNIYKIGKELFITSDENINQQTEPCWCINTIKNTWDADLIYYQGSMPQYHYVGFKKIILTDNTDLIADGVQPIDDEFLEWLINNPTCEFVKVDLIPVNTFGSEITVNGYGFDKFIYKITIPQEESKYPIGGYAPGFYSCKCINCKTEFIGDKRAVQCEPCAIKMIQEEPKKEWNPTQGEEVWIKVFSNWSLGTYIGYDIDKEIHLVREPKEGGGHLFSSKFVLPYSDMPNEPKQETLEQVAEKWYSPFGFYPDPKQGFIAGAEWQTEKMYSEEEVLELLYKRPNFINMTTTQKQEETKSWFEQNKKK